MQRKSMDTPDPLSYRQISRNVVNIFLFVAEQCKWYYSASEIPEMLETFLPLLTKEVCGRLIDTESYSLWLIADFFDHGSCFDIISAPYPYTSLSSYDFYTMESVQFISN